MDTPRTISSTNASFPAYLSFKELRRLGIAHCQALAGDLWTDFNLHDPGLTILEALCFALTDLGYRSNLPIADLLAKEPKAPGAGDRRDDNFFTPEEILTCNPVTLLDLRKLLIDVPGVRNAWIEPAEEAEVPLYLNRRANTLGLRAPQHLKGAENLIDAARVRPEGLYRVLVELDGEEAPDSCVPAAAAQAAARTAAGPGVATERVLADIRRLLHAHRNLCEDFVDLTILGLEDVALCADIEIDAGASPEEVLFGITRRLDAFMSPAPTFYSLQELLARGRRIEDIYAGRPARPLSHLAAVAAGCGDSPGSSHGFIDTEELIAIERRSRLHVSDLYREIMAVPGVLAIRNLLAVNAVNGIAKTTGERWCLKLTPGYRQRFSLPRSQLTLFKGLLAFAADDGDLKDRVAQRMRETGAASTKAPLAPHQLDLRVPAGKRRALADYRSIVHDLPALYGIGEGGLPDTADAERRAQAKQLRAYLLFYDQILAGYLAQLANLRELFSFRPTGGPGDGQTYFTQTLSDIPGISELLRNHRECPAKADDPDAAEDYPDYLARLTEDPDTYHERRNRFLDHLLARFAESFTEYVLLMFDVSGSRSDPARIIRDKVEFLQTYPYTSRNRGKGFDYTRPEVWDTPNLSGLQHRVARLLGIRDPDCGPPAAAPSDELGDLPFRRRTLSPMQVLETPGGWHWRLDPAGAGLAFGMQSRQSWPERDAAGAAFADFCSRAAEEQGVLRLTYHGAGPNGGDGFGIAVVGGDGSLLAEADRTWAEAQERDLQRTRLIERAIGGAVRSTLDQATECFFAQLVDGDGDVLLAMVAGHPTEDAAEQAFHDSLLPAARDATRYRDLDSAAGMAAATDAAAADAPRQGFGFELLAAPQGDLLARHPHLYRSARERTLRKRRILYALNHPAVQLGVTGEPGAFSLEVRDSSGVALFRGAATYPTREAAGIAYRTLLRRAQVRAAYRLLGDGSDDAGFGFELLAVDGVLLARHPRTYASVAERALAIDYLTQLFCPVEDLRTEIRRADDAFRPVLLTKDGRDLLVGALSGATEDGARELLTALLKAARQPERYAPFEQDGAFGFVLHNGTGEALATHPDTYGDTHQRDLAIRAIIGYVCPAAVRYSIDGRPGRFHGLLLDPEGGELLRTVATQTDEADAREAIAALLPLARDPVHWCRPDTEDGYGLGLRDAVELVATHGDRYATAGERDAALDMIIAYLTAPAPRSRIINPTGAYRFRLRDGAGQPVLTGTAILSSAELAEQAAAKAIELARDRRNWQTTDSGPSGCRFGFEIRDAETAPVARGPRRYADVAQRDAAMRQLYALVHQLDSIPDPLDPEYGHAFGIRDHAGVLFLRGSEAFEAQADAEQAFRQALRVAADPAALVPVETDCSYGFALKAGDLVLATHPRTYASTRERDSARLAARFTLLSGGAPYGIAEHGDGRFVFHYLGADGSIALAGSAPAADRRGALERLIEAQPRAIDPGAYAGHAEGPDADTRYGFRLTAADGRTLAAHPAGWPSAAGRDAALAAWIAQLTGQRLRPEFIPLPMRFFWRLVDLDGGQLLRSSRHWPSVTEAEQAFHQQLAGIAQGNTHLRATYDNASCTYSFELRAVSDAGPPCASALGTLLAAHGGAWPRARDRDQRLRQTLALIDRQRLDPDLLGSACGHWFVLSDQIHQLRALAYYPSRAEAALAATRLLRHLGEPETYAIEPTATGAPRLLARTPDGAIVAASAPADDAALLVMRAALIGAATSETVLPHMLEQPPAQLRCQLLGTDGEPLLPSLDGPSAELHAAMDGFADQGTRDEAIERTRAVFADQPPEPAVDGDDDAYRYRFDVAPDLVLRGRWRHVTEAEALKAAARLPALAADASNYRSRTSDGGEQGFDIIDREAAEKNRRATCKSCNELAERAQEADAFQPVTAEDACAFGFRLVNGAGAPLTGLSRLHGDMDLRDHHREEIQCLLGTEGFHLVEHLLLRPRQPSQDERLIPLGDGCVDADGNPCPPAVDPYSFRISVVVPYWPRRFRHRDFRPFFERTLRLETPAHIFPRICWVDVCQMHAFETAYRRWLRALASPNGNCDLAPAQGALIDILFSLTSVYEPGQLSDCAGAGGENPVILDRTILGTAGTDHGDSPETPT